MTSTGSSEPPTTLEEARLPLDHAARLLAIADGLCAIGQLRTGERAGQFSIFNFLIRCAPDDEYASPDDRTTYALLMQAGIVRRHGWYAYFWLPDDQRPLRLALPSPVGKSWHWHDDIMEISNRFEQSEGWTQAVGESVDEHVERFKEALTDAEVVRAAKA
ncbi:MAG: hypothetical protein OXS30_05150 [Chloroflexota bacterium]|nr:hypothetical protein [Chloroflexota bacterium]